MNKEELIDKLYETLKDSYPDCKDTIRENIEMFEKKKEPKNIIWMWMKEDYFKLKPLLKKVVNGGKSE